MITVRMPNLAARNCALSAAPGTQQPTSLDSAARTAQLVAMFAQLGDYGQRVTLAQMAAMLRVQAGA